MAIIYGPHGMTHNAPGTMPAPAGGAPGQPGVAPRQPQGIWAQLTGQGSGAGFAGNPLFMGGLTTLSGQGPASGFASAQAAQQNVWARQMQQMQMQAALEERQRKLQREAALQRIMGTPGIRKELGVWADLASNMPELVVPKILEAKMAALTADPSDRVDPNTGWSVNQIASEYKLEDYTSDSVAAARKARDPAMLIPKPEAIEKMEPGDIIKYTNLAEKRLAVFGEVQNAADQVFALLEGEGGPEQLAALIQYAKALDPGSVVREGEVALQRQVAGLFGTIETLIGQATKQEGQLLSQGQKESIASAMRKISELNAQRYGWHRQHTEELFREVEAPLVAMPPPLRSFVDPTQPGRFVSARGEEDDQGSDEKTTRPPLGPITDARQKAAALRYGIDPDAPDAKDQLLRALKGADTFGFSPEG